MLGHSFGGMLALRHAVSHPAASTVIFENPVWDIALTARSALPRIAGLLESLSRDAAARTAAKGDLPRGLCAAYRPALDAVGDQRESYFIPDQATRQALHQTRLARPRPGSIGRAAGQ